MLRRSALLMLLLTSAACCGYASANDTWMGVYLGPNKIGYMHISLTKKVQYARQVYVLTETLITRMRIEGKDIRRDSTTTLCFDLDYRPMLATYEDTDSGNSTTIEAHFLLPSRITCMTRSRAKTVQTDVTIPSGSDLAARMKYEAGALLPGVGERVVMSSFEPQRMAVTTETLRGVRKGNVIVEGRSSPAMVISHGSGRDKVVDWRLPSGRLVRSEMAAIGVVMIAEPMQKAMAGLDDKGPDLDIVAADKPIRNPRHLSLLKVRLIGMNDAGLLISDSRQHAQLPKDSSAAIYSIAASPFDAKTSAKLPIAKPDLKSYLEPADGIECKDDAITSQSRAIVGQTKSAYAAVAALRAWVQTSIKPSDAAPTALSAIDVLKHREGCCRHNAVLYAALARAAGIPTRLAAGLIYDSGGFRFHVWDESWVGRWIPIDPTYPAEFVDATHIKLVQGGIQTLPTLGRVAGRLKAEILEAK